MLEIIRHNLGECTRCKLHTTRTNIVFGVGNPRARVMLIGEAPGYYEDISGEPFVGKAGQLLNKILVAINLQRSDVYITNVVKCRPPNNRDPQSDEISMCSPFLQEQIRTINPSIIVLVGLVAAKLVLQDNSLKLKEIRGQIQYHSNLPPTIVIYHPAALLRNEDLKLPTWEDLQVLQSFLQELNNAQEI